MKKFLSLLVVVAMLVSAFTFVACGSEPETPSTTTTGTPVSTTTAGSTTPTEPVKTGYVDDGKTYSYRMGPSDLPTSWNVQTYESNSSTYVLDYSSDALYTFEYNDDFSGYKIVPSMAAGDPVDVTSKYVGQYGVEEGDKNKVYQIPLKTNLKYDNGEKIDANSFVQSMKWLLNPVAANFRADNVYKSGNLKIYNSEAYVKQGTVVFTDNGIEEANTEENIVKGDDGTYSTSDGYKLYIALDDELEWLGGDALSTYTTFYPEYFGMDAYNALLALADEDGHVAVTDETMDLLEEVISTNPAWGEDRSNIIDYMVFAVAYGEMEYDGNVGFFADEEGNLVVVLKNAMEDNFYLRYELCTSFFLVYNPLYESLIQSSQGVYTNSYGTSVETYVGFGPYKLTSYVEGAEIVLERNPYWHGYTAEDYIEGTYMTDRVVYNVVTEDATRLEMFLKGQLDSYGLRAEDMKDYQTSKYTYFSDSESTWYLVMNPDKATLDTMAAAATPVNAGYDVIKSVLDITEFRQALSYSLDRAAFNLQLSPTSGIAKALLSSMIVADPESGLTYRSLDAAKDAILEFWGLSDAWGEGDDKEYETRDEAIESITGYDPEGAKALFNTAYDKAVELGYITEAQVASGKWEIQVTLGKPSDGNFYNKGYEFLKACWTEAVAGTKLEGHVTFVQSQTLGSTSFGEYLRTGQVDILFGVGYGGSQFDPYSMMDCFTGSLEYDPFTDKKNVSLDVELDGKVLRASLYNWVSVALQGDEITAKVVVNGEETGETVTISAGTSADPATRIAILAAAEVKVLTLCNVFPLMTDASASLRCMRVNYKTEEYVVGMGRGGIEWYTYSMDDADFASYVTSQGGTLNYK